MGFFIALQFLTRFPSPFKRVFSADELGRSQAYFPLVGLLIGLLLAALDVLLRAMLPLPVVAAFLVLALVIVTGGIHLDGLIDSCDGLFVHRSQEERLAIMRDSRAGSFGVAGAALLLILKYGALVSLDGSIRPLVLMLAPVLSRWAMVYALGAFSYARSLGKGTVFHARGARPLVFATVCAALVAFAVWPERGLILLALVAMWVTLAGRMITARLGGLTGDSYGALNETAEALVLIGAIASWRGLS